MSNFPLPPKKDSKPIFKGKIPPQALDLEEYILGALIIDSRAADEVMEILSADVFFLEKHQEIFKAIKTLYDDKIGIDLAMVSNELKKKDKLGFVGGDFNLIGLTQKVSSSAHIEFHSRVVLQKYILRELIRISFSLEMSSIDIKNKITAGALNIPYSNIRQGKLNGTQLNKVFEYYDTIDKSDLNVIDTSEHKNYYHNIERKIRELAKEGTKFFIIDYVQLIKLSKSSGNDTSDISKITRDLKALASELKVTILILAQLNRNVDARPDKTPMLSDLKQSGSIEEDSDIVIFLLRDAYYQTLGKADLELPIRELGKTKFIVAKGRHVGVKTFIAFVDMLKSKMSSFFDN